MQVTRSWPAFDDRGRALLLPVDGERRRAVEAIRALDLLASMGDDEEQIETFAALVKAINHDRMSDRKRFDE